MSIPEIVRQVEPSVVAVLTDSGERSGVVWDSAGKVVTNRHVVERATRIELAFVADLLDERDFTMGRTVAATGTMDFDGDVGLVGGVPQKAIAVEDSGADIFLVPQQEVDQASREGLTVRGVDELGEALALLAGGGPAGPCAGAAPAA